MCVFLYWIAMIWNLINILLLTRNGLDLENLLETLTVNVQQLTGLVRFIAMVIYF